MAETERAQIYLITPPEVDLATFPRILNSVLDATDVACVRLALSSRDEDQILRAGDCLREITHARDIPLVIEAHLMMVQRLGLDGVHLTDGARSVRKARKQLGKDAIVGAFCGTSRHDGMNAGEAGADYVSFGPVGASSLGDGAIAAPELFQWWSDVIEIPVVAEGGIDQDNLATLSSVTDFIGLGVEIWNTDDPATRIKSLLVVLT